MARTDKISTWTGIGAALLLTATATGFAWAASNAPATPAAPPEPPPPMAGHGHPHEGGPMGGFMPPMMMMGHLAEKLGLSAEQKTAVHKALDEARPGFESLHEQMRGDIDRLRHTRPDDPAYQGLVASASQSASQTAAQMVLQASQLRSRLFGILTPAQRDQLVKLEAEHAEHMREGHPRGMGHGMEHGMEHGEAGDAHRGHEPPPASR